MEKKTIRVFVSMPFRGRTREKVFFILHDVKVKLECTYFSEYDVKCICNFDYEAPKGGIKKIHQLGNAIKIMAECDAFVVLVDSKKKKPVTLGCKLEEKIWRTYGEQDKVLYVIDDYGLF